MSIEVCRIETLSIPAKIETLSILAISANNHNRYAIYCFVQVLLCLFTRSPHMVAHMLPDLQQNTVIASMTCSLQKKKLSCIKFEWTHSRPIFEHSNKQLLSNFWSQHCLGYFLTGKFFILNKSMGFFDIFQKKNRVNTAFHLFVHFKCSLTKQTFFSTANSASCYFT